MMTPTLVDMLDPHWWTMGRMVVAFGWLFIAGIAIRAAFFEKWH